MGEPENNEIKILIDALKYTSNIIVDLTNKLGLQEEKITILENKINKIQKVSMENNLKLKTIDIEKLNKILSHEQKNNFKDPNNSDEISQYIFEKNDKNGQNGYNGHNGHNGKTNKSEQITQNKLSCIAGDKNKIDKLIGSIVKRKNDLNQFANENKEKDIIIEYGTGTGNDNTKTNKSAKSKFSNGEYNENSGLDFTIKTEPNKSNYDSSKTAQKTAQEHSKTNYANDEENITKAQNDDLNKANNILKQIRRRANIKRM